MGDYFIRLDDATGLRRTILESSKASVNVLRAYQHILKTRGEKRTMLKALRREMKELTVLINRLDELVPALSKSEVAELQPKKVEPPRPPKRSQRKAQRLPQLPPDKTVYLGQPTTEKPKPVQRREQQPAPEAPKKSTELDSLHDKLASIEDKLKRL